MLQPVTVRHARTGHGYELIAGERRLRAAARLGWADVPALVRDVDDRTLLTLALVENLQRSDLNPIEEAEGYRRLIEEFKLTQQQVADAVGKDRTTVANLLRVLALPVTVRHMLEQGELTLGQARPLLALGDERRIVQVAQEIVTHGFTAREVERRVMAAVPERRRDRGSQKRSADPGAGAETRRIEEQIRRYLQTDVRLSLSGPERGTIQIAFYSAEDLERLLDLMLGSAREAT
jgi:ParB family chromosome partitioning protein